MDLERLCRRFEVAVGNFGRSCVAMKANERAFHAWYASSVIQEFGLARVYMEVHLVKERLSEKHGLVQGLFLLPGVEAFTSHLAGGNELFPDLSVSWRPDIDARHSATRDSELHDPGRMLCEFGIVSELKVVSSTQSPTARAHLVKDLAKLGLFAKAQQLAAMRAGLSNGLATYLVILDNSSYQDGKRRNHCGPERMNDVFGAIRGNWPNDVQKPAILVASPDGSGTKLCVYRNFEPIPEVL